jgi:transposase InsO family protein
VNAILRDLDPIAVQSRTPSNPRRRRRYIVKGPNRVWSIDGHDKLSAYGFQIYGIIDAYSRKILGMFIGLSNRTQIAVLKYYLRTIKEYGVPKLIRADKGAETILLAASQFAFRKARKPHIPLEKTIAYGTSTKNQRIERWWRTLVDQQTDQWIAYFDELRGAGLFDSSKYDRIAL